MRIPSHRYVSKSHFPTDASNPAPQQKPAKTSVSIPPRPATDDKSVTVTVSDKARELAENATLDEAKVQRLRNALEKGQFAVFPNAIAEKIVNGE